MSLQSFDWFAERLELAKWESEEPGSRSGFFNCPIHGGSDSLHLTEKNGKALGHCFACQADGPAVQAALETMDDDAVEVVQSDDPPAKVTITRRRGREDDPSDTSGSPPETGRRSRGVRLPAASTTPLDWLAARCGLTREQLDELKLPLSEKSEFVVFEFPGTDAAKLRAAAEGKKNKDFRWAGSSSPPLWPMPTDPSDEVVVCEGEADAICLRASGLEAYSITKGSASTVPAIVWESLVAHGVKTVWLAFDLDDAGRKGRQSAADGARAAGLIVKESRVAGIRPLAGEKDARDVALRQGYPLELEHDADEDDPTPLEDVKAMTPESLWLGRIHPYEHTILYGDGGTGKGVVAAWWVARLTRAGKRVLVVDYEFHVNYEWRPRVEGFGGRMDMVSIVQPTKPIWDIQGWLREKAEPFDLVVVDSVSYACVGEEVEKSVTATKYSMAVNQIGKPVLSIAHVTKADADPNHPFGSIFWSNGARVTVSVSRQKVEEATSPRVLRNAKTNQRGPFQNVAIDWSWLGNDGPPGCSHAHAYEPRDQAPPPHLHLHEMTVVPKVRQMVSDARQRFLATHNREPNGREIFDMLSVEFPEGHPSEGHCRVELSRILKKERDATGPSVTRVKRDQGDDDDLDG